MDNQTQMIGSVFETRNLHLTPVDPEVDAVIEATWMTDQAYAEDRRPSPARPASVSELKKLMQADLKKMKDTATYILFAVRRKLDEQLVGFICFDLILWNHRSGRMKILFGGQERFSRYGKELLDLCLTYVFTEMNFHHISVDYPEYRQEVIDLHLAAGFREEVRRRQAHYYHGRYWDRIHLGLLKDGWRKVSEES